MRIALAQINPTVGDLPGNADLILETARRGAAGGAQLIVFPELSLTGYPPRDLVEKPSFLERTGQQLERLAHETAGLGASLICGYVGRSASPTGKSATNSAAVIERGEIIFRQSKMLLPTYDVFDEARYFVPAEHQGLCEIQGSEGGPDDLRGRLERQTVLGAAAIPPGPGRRARGAGRGSSNQHQRLAVSHGQEGAAP